MDIQQVDKKPKGGKKEEKHTRVISHVTFVFTPLSRDSGGQRPTFYGSQKVGPTQPNPLAIMRQLLPSQKICAVILLNEKTPKVLLAPLLQPCTKMGKRRRIIEI